MLDVFREGAKSWLSKVFIWGVAFTFVGAAFMVWGQQGAQRLVAVAMVGDEEITRADWYQRTKAIENNLRAQLGGQLDPELLKSLNSRSMALDALIEEALMRREAVIAGVDVSDEEARETVMGMREFMTDGMFDRRKYQDILNLNGYKPADFEANIRQDILTAKFRSLIQRAVRVSDAEALDGYLGDNQEVVVAYAEASEESLRKEISPSDDELKDWYSKRQLEFETPDRRKFRIMTAYPGSFELTVSVSEEEMKDYYDKHTEEFDTSEAVEASHILAKVQMDAPAEADKAARAKVEKALARVEAGEDFAEVARQMSEDAANASKGGALGKFTRGQMVQAFEDVVFTMSTDEISKPFKTPFGWHVVKVTRKIESGVAEFSQVKELVRVKAKKAKAADEAETAIYGAAEKATVDNFKQIAEDDKKLRLEQLTLSRNNLIPDIPDSKEIMETLFSMEKGTISDVIVFDEGYALLALDGLVPAASPPFKEVRRKVRARYISEKARKLGREKTEKVEAMVRDEKKTFAEAVRAVGLEVKTTKPFSATSLRANKGEQESGQTSQAFAMEKGEVKSVPGMKGYMAVLLVNRQPIDYSLAAEKIEASRQGLLAAKRDKALAQVVSQLRKKAEEAGEIEIFEKIDNGV
ncbi:MAG: SurA N-terminal domain-containing protein [Nitrospinota bacterium]|nr:SurA N-terminal domain-containing protein [Nitrospinota bacterium]